MRKRRSSGIDEVDDFVETLLRAGPFPGDDEYERQCNAVLHQINQYRAGIGGDEIDAELLEPELRTAVIQMVYRGRDPSSVPYRHLRHAVENPIGFDDIGPKYRSIINGPLKAIRAKCIGCMGGSAELVRSCSSINCFLWPFRMTTNPFYGRLVSNFNEGDDEDGFEGDAEAEAVEAEYEAEEAARLAVVGTSRRGNS